MNGHKVGHTNPVISAPCVSGDVISIGDLLWYDSGNSYAVRPASAYTWDTNLLTTQTSFKLVFAGVALDAKPSGSTNSIRVGQTGEYEFDAASATFEVGDKLGPAKASGNALENQKLAVAVIAGAVGRSTKRVNPAGTKVQAYMQGTMTRGAIAT